MHKRIFSPRLLIACRCSYLFDIPLNASKAQLKDALELAAEVHYDILAKVVTTREQLAKDNANLHQEINLLKTSDEEHSVASLHKRIKRLEDRLH